MPQVIFQEYRDSNRLSKYPFEDTATLVSVSGDVTVPEEIFCDASIYIPGAVSPVYIQNIASTSSGITLTVSDYSKQYTATGKITPRSNSVELLNDSGQQVGILAASADLTYFTNLPKGVHEFTYKATSFVPRCIVTLMDVGVTSIGVKDGKQLYGDVWLVGKDGIVLRYVDDTIRIDIVGDPLFKREDESFEAPKFIQTINGVPANEFGDFKITVGEEKDILRIENSSEGIKIYAAGV